MSDLILTNKNIREFLEALGSEKVAPGGGSLGFLLISAGASAILKTVRISQKNFPDETLFIKNINYLQKFIDDFLQYIDKDAMDYQEAVKYIKTDKTQFVSKLIESTEFLIKSVEIALNLLKITTEFSSFIKDSVYSDLDCGKYSIVAGMLILIRTAYANLKYIKGPEHHNIREKLGALKIKVDQIKYTM